jgi:glycosyltransferase involved in cell wall biosynthesis
MAEVVIAIPTFKRPKSLARLLNALEKLKTLRSILVLVADNDAESHEGHDLCQTLKARFRWPLEAIVVKERGIAQVRNALVARALDVKGVKFVAMIDDDEWPSEDWLDRFLRVQAATKADALQGSILFAHEGQSEWAKGREGLSSIRRPTGPVDMLQGAGNLLLTRDCLEALEAPWFDPDFALTGGEDREFFVRLSEAGMCFAWADEAIAYADVPAARLNLGWVLKRAYSVGNSDMRVTLKYFPGRLRMTRELAVIAGAFVVSPVLLLALGYTPKRRLDALSLMSRAAGKTVALFGRRYDAYTVTHGE